MPIAGPGVAEAATPGACSWGGLGAIVERPAGTGRSCGIGEVSGASGARCFGEIAVRGGASRGAGEPDFAGRFGVSAEAAIASGSTAAGVACGGSAAAAGGGFAGGRSGPVTGFNGGTGSSTAGLAAALRRGFAFAPSAGALAAEGAAAEAAFAT